MQNSVKKLVMATLVAALALGGYIMYQNYYATTQDNVKIQCNGPDCKPDSRNFR